MSCIASIVVSAARKGGLVALLAAGGFAMPASQALAQDDSSVLDAARADAASEERAQELVAAIERARAEDYDAARSAFEQLIADPELGAHAIYGLGMVDRMQGRTSAAVDRFEEALEVDPAFGPAMTALVRHKLATGTRAAARTFVRDQLEASGHAPSIRASALLLDLVEERYEAVIEAGRSVLLEDPANLDAHYAMAQANLGLGRVEIAEFIVDQGLDHDRPYRMRTDLLFMKYEFATMAGDVSGACRALQQVLDVDPTHLEATNELAVWLIEQRRPSFARSLLEPVTRRHPDYAPAWINLGNAWKTMGASASSSGGDVCEPSEMATSSGDESGRTVDTAANFRRADESYRRALALDSDLASAYFNRGVLYLDSIGTDFDAGLTATQRAETALENFQQYLTRADAAPGHRVHEYRGYARQVIENAEALENNQ